MTALAFRVAQSHWKLLRNGVCWIRPPGAVSEEGDLQQQDDDGRAEEVLDDLEIRFQSGDLALEVGDVLLELRLDGGEVSLGGDPQFFNIGPNGSELSLEVGFSGQLGIRAADGGNDCLGLPGSSALRSDLVASSASARLMAATTASACRGSMPASSSCLMVAWVSRV